MLDEEPGSSRVQSHSSPKFDGVQTAEFETPGTPSSAIRVWVAEQSRRQRAVVASRASQSGKLASLAPGTRLT